MLEKRSGEEGGPVLFGAEATIDSWIWPLVPLFSRMQLLITGSGPGLSWDGVSIQTRAGALSWRASPHSGQGSAMGVAGAIPE